MIRRLSSSIEMERPMLQTQIGGSGSGGIITATSSTTIPDDDEPSAAVLEAEAFLLCQRITRMINVTNQRNVILNPTSLSP